MAKYVRCISKWENITEWSIVGKVYDTSIRPDFSAHSWQFILDFGKYFEEANEADWNSQEGIESKIVNDYEIY